MQQFVSMRGVSLSLWDRCSWAQRGRQSRTTTLPPPHRSLRRRSGRSPGLPYPPRRQTDCITRLGNRQSPTLPRPAGWSSSCQVRASGLRRRTQLTKFSISASMMVPPRQWNGSVLHPPFYSQEVGAPTRLWQMAG